MTKNLLGLFVALALCFFAAGIGAFAASRGLNEWYPALRKPSWNPPSWVFGFIWSSLYTMMAVASWLVWRRRATAPVATPLSVFAVQLLLNAAWPMLFFSLRSPGLGFLEIILLWLVVATTVGMFWRVSNAAGMVMVPYLLWITFAMALNGSIWSLNTG
jgi:benzodiazapine receptor